MKNEHILQRNCPVCKGKFGKIMHHITYMLPEGIHLPTGYNIVSCSECGFAFADMNGSQNIYNEYYETYNMYSENEELKDDRMTEKNAILESITSVATKDSSILDVGCGDGNLLVYLAKQGFTNLTGMDPSSKSVDKLKQKGIKGFVGNIFDEICDMHVGQYDVVMSAAVAEHIYDLDGFIKKMEQYVSEKGHILLSVPAVEGLELGKWPVSHHFNHEHINFFSKVSLNNLMQAHGFRACGQILMCQTDTERGLVGIYSKAENAGAIQYDDISEKCIQGYFERIDESEWNLIMDDLITRKEPIVIWGAGSLTMQLLAQYPLLLEEIVQFVDNNSTKWGSDILGKKIGSPNEIYNLDEKTKIVISALTNVADIEAQIDKMGLKNEVISVR